MNKLNNGLLKVEYSVPPMIRLLNLENSIGNKGENLTIIILSCNRVFSTIKLLKSIYDKMPFYSGKIIVADNASSPNEKTKLKMFLKTYLFKIKLIEFEENFGVAAGRNKAIEQIETDWALNLDNDIYFVANPISHINDALQTLACKFLNIPLLNETGNELFANGGSLYLDLIEKNVHLGCGSMYAQRNSFPGESFHHSLGSFLYGGASVIHVESFKQAGMFDENMFVGFEDYDFSISLLKKGFKIGNCGFVGLLHDHKEPDNKEDIEYEKIRFSNEKLLNSAIYLEKKHNIIVWNKSTQEWLENKKKTLGIENELNPAVDTKQQSKKKIALITDTDDWCFHNIASQIKKYLSDEFEIKIIPFEYLDLNIVRLFLSIQSFDLIHFFWRGHLNFLFDKFVFGYTNLLGSTYEKFIEDKVYNLKITTSIYDHNFLNSSDKEGKELTNNVLGIVKDYSVSSKQLQEIYDKITVDKKPTIITDGVDLKRFYQKNKNRFNIVENKILKIGWVGNSKFYNPYVEDLKGLETIIKPTIEELKSEGYKIEEYFADKQVRMIPFEQMPEYYNEIDIYICASLNEGTPNPVLEAMACGVPVISTDVGIVKEVFGKKQKQFIINRDKNSLKQKLKNMLDDQSVLKELSIENQQQIVRWDWKNKCEDFREFFKKNIEVKDEESKIK